MLKSDRLLRMGIWLTVGKGFGVVGKRTLLLLFEGYVCNGTVLCEVKMGGGG